MRVQASPSEVLAWQAVVPRNPRRFSVFPFSFCDGGDYTQGSQVLYHQVTVQTRSLHREALLGEAATGGPQTTPEQPGAGSDPWLPTERNSQEEQGPCVQPR